jgi:hypothetical protein
MTRQHLNQVAARFKTTMVDVFNALGGKEGVAQTADRSPSTVGEWRNLNNATFPPVDCAFALDRVLVAMGQRPEILHRYAAELGFALFQLPEAAGDEALSAAMIDVSAEFGDIAGEVRDATRDGVFCARDRDKVVRQVDEAMASLMRLRGVASAMGGK